MKIWTLLENTSCREELEAEHGLSLYIETGDQRILFDAGQSDAFARNAEKMGVDLGAVTLAILSHGHYDHGGGLPAFLERNRTAPVYVNRMAFEPHYNGREKYIGLPEALREASQLVLTGEETEIRPGMTLYACNNWEKRYPFHAYGLNVERNGELYPDDFCHEQYLLIREGDKTVLFSGCSHKGILNITDWFRPDVLVGGFHFKKLDPAGAGAPRLRQAAEVLMDYPTRYYTCHCTGIEQYRFLKEIMGDRLSYLSAGSYLEL